MIKIISYEFRKIFQHKLVLLVIVLSILLMGFVLLKEEPFVNYNSVRRDEAAYQEYLSLTAGMEYDEAIERLHEERSKARMLYLETGDRMDYMIKSSILSRITGRYEYLASYDDYIAATLKQSEQVQKVSFYADNAFVLSDAKKVQEDYSRLTDIALSRDAALFVWAVASFDTADYILLFQFLLFAILIFGFEDENIKRLLRVQDKGRHHVFCAKAVALSCACTIIILCTYLYLILIGFAYFGPGAFDVPVQSLESFMGSKYLITIGEFLILFSVFKVLSGWIFAFIFSLFIILAGNILGSVLSILVSALFYIAYFTINGRKLLSPLKYINPAAWFDVNGWISEYANINFFTKAVSFETAFAAGAAVLFVLLFALSFRFYIKESNRRGFAALSRLSVFSARILEKFIERTTIVFHEVYRLLAEGYKWLLVTIFIAASVLVMNNVVKGSDYDNRAYLYHLGRIEAEYSDETVEYLEKYMAYLEETDGYRASLEASYAEGEFSKEEYELAINELESEKQTIDGFEILYKQGEYLERQNGAGIENLGFVSKAWSDRVLLNRFYMVVLELLLVCAMFVVFGGYLTFDYNVFGLIKSTYRGRYENQCMKIANLLVYALLIVVPPLIVYYMRVLEGYEPAMLDFGIRSIDMYSLSDMDISIENMLIISMICKYVGVVCIGLFMYFLSLYHLPKAVFQIIVLAVVVMPPAIEIMDAPIDFFGFSGFFYMEQMFKRGIGSVVMYPATIFVLLTIFGFFAVRHYRGKQGIKRRAGNGKHS